MEVKEIPFDENVIFETVVKPCQRGEWIYLICGSRTKYNEIKSMLKDYVSFKRGLFTYKGIIFFTINDREEVHSYVDQIIKLRITHGRPKKRSQNKKPL